MEVKVYKIDGSETGKSVVLDDSIFGIDPNDHAIYLDVKRILADRRQGTSKSKERSELSGSTRKLFRQKGTGGARRGDINSPLLRGGARVFGPEPRDYNFKLNKKVKKLAKMSALTHKAKDLTIKVLEDFQFDAPKTSAFTEILKSFDASNKKSLFVLGELNKNVYLSSRNLKKVNILTASNLNTYDILHAQNLFITEAGLSQIEETLKNEA